MKTRDSKFVQISGHLLTLAVVFITLIIISNIASTKIIPFGPLTVDAGTLLFFFVYILGDAITEVYGFKAAKKVIWLGFMANLLMAFTLAIVNILPPATDWPHQEAFNAILGQTPRIVLGSLIAYLVGSFTNSLIMAKMKVWQRGKNLWMRTIASTLVGEGLDSLLFVLIAFAGSMPANVLLSIMLANYIIKCTCEILATPLTYQLIAYLKKSDKQDAYDTRTDMNPFTP